MSEEAEMNATSANVLADALNMMAVHYGMSEGAARRVLLDALGHSDCVPREQLVETLTRESEAQRRHDAWRDGVEEKLQRAERERDALRADNDRLCGALEDLRGALEDYGEHRPTCPRSAWECSCGLRAALSADVEPSRTRHIQPPPAPGETPEDVEAAYAYVYSDQPDVETDALAHLLGRVEPPDDEDDP